jgi:IPT/TIG domain
MRFLRPTDALARLVLLAACGVMTGTADARAKTAGRAQATRQTVRIDHSTGVVSPAGSIGLANGEEFVVALDNTYPSCYTYNVEVVQPAAVQEKGVALTPETVLFVVKHDGRATAYRIRATRRATADAACPLASGSWEIPVEPHEWALALTGAFTIDGLTDPAFFLEPTTRPGVPGQPDQAGFHAKRDKNAEDSFTLGLASMIHLFHSNPAYLRVFVDEVTWSPVSFGIAVAGENSSAKYFLGTSLKVSSKFYLTVGYAFGPERRLPTGVTTSTFLENANALNSLPTRRTSRPFVALSYSFIDVSPSRFKNLFVEPKPEAKATPGGGEASPPALVISLDPKEGPAGTPVKITVSGAAFTGDPEKDTISVDEKNVQPTASIKKGATEAVISIPEGSKGSLSIVVEIDGVFSAPQEFVVKPQ